MVYRWSFASDDPSVFGWIVTSSYIVAAALCWRAGTLEASPYRRLSAWRLLSAVLAVLGVNKQLDFQILFMDVGRAVVRYEGWYEQRRELQALFIAVVALMALGAIFAAARSFGRAETQTRLATIGCLILMGFVLIRAASFHHVDQALGIRIGNLALTHLVELAGIVVIGAAAARVERPNTN